MVHLFKHTSFESIKKVPFTVTKSKMLQILLKLYNAHSYIPGKYVFDSDRIPSAAATASSLFDIPATCPICNGTMINMHESGKCKGSSSKPI